MAQRSDVVVGSKTAPVLDTMKLVRGISTAVVVVLVVYPLLWLLLGSMQSSTGAGFFHTYVDAVRSPYFGEMIWNSAVMSIGTTVLAVIMGTPLAWIVVRTDTPFRPVLMSLALVPFITPPVLAAIAWSYLGSPNSGILNLLWRSVTHARGPLFDIYSMPGLIWVMALSLTPYVFVFTSTGLENMDPALENASSIAGSSPRRTTLTITLPLMMPAILSGALLVFIQSLEIFAIPATIGVPAGIYVFVTQIYQLIQELPPNYGEAAALSVPVLAICGLALLLQNRLLGRGKSYATVAGKALRPQRIHLGAMRYVALGYALSFLFFSAALPYLVFLYGAFIKSSGLPPYPENLTTRYLTEFFAGSEGAMVLRAIRNSLILSISGAAIATVMAALIAYFVQRGRWRGAGLLNFLALAPVAVPGAVLAIGLLWAYIRPPFELYGTLTILLLAYVTRNLPYGVQAVGASLAQVSDDLEKAARITGAPWGRAFRTVVLPVLIPGLLSGWVLMFVSMMRELSASIMLFSSNTETLAVALYLLWDEALFQKVSILSLIIVVLALVPIAFVRWLVRSTGLGGVRA